LILDIKEEGKSILFGSMPKTPLSEKFKIMIATTKSRNDIFITFWLEGLCRDTGSHL
jgi:hypothetical protein